MSKYKFKFFFEYGAGGCLWPADEKTFNEFNCPADAFVYDLNGNVIYNPLNKLNINKDILETINDIDCLYYNYLNQDYPPNTLITDEQKSIIINKSKNLYNKIVEVLGKNYEIIWDFNL